MVTIENKFKIKSKLASCNSIIVKFRTPSSWLPIVSNRPYNTTVKKCYTNITLGLSDLIFQKGHYI